MISDKILHAIIAIFLIILGLGIIFISYISFFYMPTPVEFHNIPVPVWQDHRNLCVTLDYTRYTTAPVTITRTFKDGILFATAPTAASGNIKGRQTEVICFSVPSTLPEGKYIIVTDLEFHVNNFVTRTATWESEEIYIFKHDGR